MFFVVCLGLVIFGIGLYNIGAQMERKSERAMATHIYYHHVKDKR